MCGKRFAFLFLLPFFYISGNAQEPAVVKFNNILTLNVSMNYNYMVYEQSSLDHSLQSNRPWDFGVNIGFLNISLGFSFSVPFLYDQYHEKSQSYDISFNNYNDKSFTSGYIRYYSGFNNGVDKNIDLKIFSMGISWAYVFNEDHSIRAVYNLDRKQTVSNGSFLIGGGLSFSSINSTSSLLSNYKKEQNTFYSGPNIGYSYTWILGGDFFINVLSTIGANYVLNNWKLSAGFQASPKFSVGYHSKYWSLSVYSNYSYIIAGFDTELEYNILSGNIGLSIIRRF